MWLFGIGGDEQTREAKKAAEKEELEKQKETTPEDKAATSTDSRVFLSDLAEIAKFARQEVPTVKVRLKRGKQTQPPSVTKGSEPSSSETVLEPATQKDAEEAPGEVGLESYKDKMAARSKSRRSSDSATTPRGATRDVPTGGVKVRFVNLVQNLLHQMGSEEYEEARRVDSSLKSERLGLTWQPSDSMRKVRVVRSRKHTWRQSAPIVEQRQAGVESLATEDPSWNLLVSEAIARVERTWPSTLNLLGELEKEEEHDQAQRKMSSQDMLSPRLASPRLSDG